MIAETDRISLALLVLLAVCTQAAARSQASVSAPSVSQEMYRRVLDLVFPRDTGNFKNHKKEYALTLRFTPVFGLESQINITSYSDRRVEIVTYTLGKGSQSISQQLGTMFGQSVEEMAKRINVEKAVITDTGKIQGMLNRFSAIRFSPRLDTAITLDGTGFHLWYEAVSNESHYSLAGGEPGHDRGDHPLVRWMNEVRQALLK